MKRYFTVLALLPVILFIAWIVPPAKTTVYMIGDSTMAIKEKKTYPETGWGMPFANYFDSTVVIDNRAKNGRSTRTFIDEGLWQPVAQGLKPGDYLIIQFGHNDEVPTKKSATTPAQFKAYLESYIAAAKAKQANAILITPVARRKFDSVGHVLPTHTEYAQIVRTIAKEKNIPLIDLDMQGQALYQQLGAESSKALFNYLEPGQNPNYPKGKQDDTHFNEYGARRIAEIVLKDLVSLKLPLASHITGSGL